MSRLPAIHTRVVVGILLSLCCFLLLAQETEDASENEAEAEERAEKPQAPPDTCAQNPLRPECMDAIGYIKLKEEVGDPCLLNPDLPVCNGS